LLDKNEQLRLEILLDQHHRMYCAGGRAPATWRVMLAAVACGLAPLVLMLPFSWQGTPRLRFVPFWPIILDLGIPIAVALIALITARWAAPRQRRQVLVVAGITATILTAIIYVTNGTAEDLGFWMIWHLLETAATTLAVLVAMRVGGSSRPSAGYRWSVLDILDRAGRDRRPAATSAHYRSSPSSARKSRHQAAEPAE
jgi:hypothetical protein